MLKGLCVVPRSYMIEKEKNRVFIAMFIKISQRCSVIALDKKERLSSKVYNNPSPIHLWF